MTNQLDQTNLPKISVPAQRALANAGITHLEQLTTVSETDILKLHGVGRKGITILRDALEAKGLTFAEATSNTKTDTI